MGYLDASAEGITFVFNGDYNATIDVTVEGEVSVGTLEMDASWTLDGSGEGATLHGEYAGTGDGAITGSRTDLNLNGTGIGGGEITVESGGFSRTFPAQHSPQAIHIDAKVTSASCSEAYLDWQTSWNVQIEDGEPYWSWIGPDTETYLGGSIAIDPDKPGPRIIDGMSWTVIAIDDELNYLAVSEQRWISP